VQAWHSPAKPLARFMNSRGRQLSYYTAAAFFSSDNA
jgi:hypothetical protein